MIPAETEEEDLKQTVKMDEELYRTILQKQMGVSLDELLSWYQEEIEKTRADVFDIAGRLDIPEPAPTTMEEINEILFKYEGPCDTPEEMLARANEYLNGQGHWRMSMSGFRRMKRVSVYQCRSAAKIPTRGADMKAEISVSGRLWDRCF